MSNAPVSVCVYVCFNMVTACQYSGLPMVMNSVQLLFIDISLEKSNCFYCLGPHSILVLEALWSDMFAVESFFNRVFHFNSPFKFDQNTQTR